MSYEIYNEDCLEGMKRIPDGSVDFICTDLPYNMTDCDFDKSSLNFSALWKEFYRVTKKNASIALFAKGKFLIELATSNLNDYRYKIVWEKPLATGHLNANRMFLQAHEDILIFYRQLPTYNPQFWKGKARTYVPPNIEAKCYRDKTTMLPTVNDGTKCYPRDVLKFNVVQGHETRYHSTQ